MIRSIVQIPDPILRTKTTPVTLFNERLADFVSDLIESMISVDGLGLAAPQLGSTRRLFVMNIPHTSIYINPILLGQHGEQIGEESCLSIPNVKMQIARPSHIVIRAQDINGAKFEQSLESLAARVFMHELDHLNSILITDYEDAGALIERRF
jgi:peptide deformylase